MDWANLPGSGVSKRHGEDQAEASVAIMGHMNRHPVRILAVRGGGRKGLCLQQTRKERRRGLSSITMGRYESENEEVHNNRHASDSATVKAREDVMIAA